MKLTKLPFFLYCFNFVNRKLQVLTMFLPSLWDWEGPNLISESLLCLFNLSLNRRIFPNEWKSAILVTLLFLLYKNDLPNYLRSLNRKCTPTIKALPTLVVTSTKLISGLIMIWLRSMFQLIDGPPEFILWIAYL